MTRDGYYIEIEKNKIKRKARISDPFKGLELLENT